MKTPRQALRLTSLAAASGLLFAGAAAQAQTAGQAPFSQASQAPASTTQLETVVVSGIRRALETSVNLKRSSSGLVDGIVAEDIGKFPDTNLAESLSRISGVSIDRSNGEGTRVTVRGMGPDFNLVLLNGRQMPGASIDSSAPASRSFDFSNLASDGVAALEVFKTSRASSPTGGMGATINIRTPRPLDNKETIAQIGVKVVRDDSARRLPGEQKGKSLTPELSGIYSTQTSDGAFGVALMGTYQERDSGYNQATRSGRLEELRRRRGWLGRAARRPVHDHQEPARPHRPLQCSAEHQLLLHRHPSRAAERPVGPSGPSREGPYRDAGFRHVGAEVPPAPQ